MTNSSDNVTLAPGVYHDVPAEKYHKIKAVSASFLKRFIIDTPYDAKAMLDGNLDSDEAKFIKGTAIHSAILEPEKFDSQFAVCELVNDVGDEVTKNSKAWKLFVADNLGKSCLKKSEMHAVDMMRKSLWGDPIIASLIRACETRELTIIWTHKTTGLPCKARIDLFSIAKRILLDLKSTTDIKRFTHTAWDNGYHIQMGWYQEALDEVEMRADTLGFLAVETTAPQKSAVFEPTQEWFILGRRTIDEVMPRVAKCFETDRWPGLSDDGSPVTLDVPAWVKR